MAALASSLFFAGVLALSIITIGKLIGTEWQRIVAALRRELPVSTAERRSTEKPLWDWSRPPRRSHRGGRAVSVIHTTRSAARASASA